MIGAWSNVARGAVEGGVSGVSGTVRRCSIDVSNYLKLLILITLIL